MISLLSVLPLVLVASTLAQYEGYEGYHHSHGLEDYHHKHAPQQSLDGHDEFDLDYHAHPKYTFDYSVKDPHTGDDKEHWETRDGDKVKGSYTILENDGTKRVVEYEADDKNGFNAVVHKIGTPKHEEYHAKPAHEPVAYHHHDYTQFDEGFVPIAGGYGHGHGHGH